MPSQTLMVDFPAVVKFKVLENLDIFSILKLCKVCFSLREFIDENPPKPMCSKLRVSISSESISIQFGSPKWITISF
ncbi:hypothetical protein CRE_23341 [Caenorhabditis remanei]|uniref:F-box domain-containing protein n=1 Tax=Caenorhabditis remanei TaxID=31234 RepID=E3MGY6_CAERE|nr:hypothetical protein CRE_23341 [Caenorhabditis remanei]